MKYAKAIITLFLLLAYLSIFAQKKHKFAERLIFSSTVCYLDHSDDALPNIERQEWAWNNSLSINLTSSLYFGLGYFHIRALDASPFAPPQRQTYYMATAFLHYDIFPIIVKRFNLSNTNVRFYPDIHWGYGDYSFYDFNNNSEKENSHYLGYGFGLDVYIKKRLAVNFGLLGYEPLNEKIDTSGRAYYTYKIGLSFDIVSK